MIPLLQAIKLKQTEHRIPMWKFYAEFDITRQGFHQAERAFEAKQAMIKQIADMVIKYRTKVDCRAGSRTIYYNLGIKDLFNIGVTKFEAMLSAYSLALKPLRVRVITTKSDKQSWNYPNLANGLRIDNINQLVVGDITYVYIDGKRYYLFCLTDVYSARIVGHCFSTRMRSIEAQSAARRWIKLRVENCLLTCIHHTDGGTQYFSGEYLKVLNDLEVQISCAKNCLQNGYAEQRNGLIKHHLLPTMQVNSVHGMARNIDRIIKRYNYDRKQKALGWKSPVEFEEHIKKTGIRPVRNLFKFTDLKNGF